MHRASPFRPLLAASLALLMFGSAVSCRKEGAAAPAAGSAPAAAAAASAARTPDGAESPQAVVDRAKKAAEEKNMSEVVAVLSPKARKEMAAAMYLGATMMVAFSQMGSQMGGAMTEGMTGMAEGAGATVSDADKAKAKEQMETAQKELAKLSEGYNAVMKKHGLPVLPKEGEAAPPELSKEELDKTLAGIDHRAFITEVMALLDSMPGAKKASEESPFEFKDAKLENLKIEGDKATGNVGTEAVKFVQVDGRWYLDADPMGGGMGEPGAVESGAAPPVPPAS